MAANQTSGRSLPVRIVANRTSWDTSICVNALVISRGGTPPRAAPSTMAVNVAPNVRLQNWGAGWDSSGVLAVESAKNGLANLMV